MKAQDYVARFVEVYNASGSDVYPLYGEAVDWIEMPSGRCGGREELFAALQGVRSAMSNLHLDVLSVVANDSSALLESEFSGTINASGETVKARVLWILSFDAAGKIIKEHDYTVPVQG